MTEHARAALGYQIAREATQISWWLEEGYDLGVDNIPDSRDAWVAAREKAIDDAWRHPAADWDDPVPEPPAESGLEVFVTLVISNLSDSAIAGPRVSLGHTSGYWTNPRTVARLLPHREVRLPIFVNVVGETASRRFRPLLMQNHHVEWVEFADSHGHLWRRHKDGRLEALDPDVAALLAPDA